MLNIEETTVSPDIKVLSLTGRITLGRNSQEFEWRVDALMANGDTKVVVDVSGVDYIDSTGVGMLVMCAGKMKANGGQIRVVGPKGAVAQTLALCKVNEIVPICSTVPEALASLAKSGAAGAA